MALSVTHMMAHALDKHSKEIADAIINNNALSAWLKASNRVKIVDGGLTFHEKIMYSEAGFDWISKDEEITLNTPDFLTDAEYNIRILAGPLVVHDFDKRRASSESQVADLVETTIENAKSTMSNKLGAAVYNDGTVAKALHGLQLIIADAAGATVGGIDSATYPWWERTLGTNIGTFNTSQEGIQNITDLINACAQNDHDRPDLLVTTSAVWSLYMLSTTNVTRLRDTRIGNLGFQALDFMGIPLVWDSNCPASHLYAINSKYLFLRILQGGEFVTSSWERVQGKLADYATMHMYGQLTVNNRSKLGVIASVA